MKSVKTKIIALVVGCILVSSLAVGGASIINSRRVVTSDSKQIMNLLCTNRAQEINTLFMYIEQSVQTLAVYTAAQMDDLERFQTDPDYVQQYADKLLGVAVNAAQNTKGAMTVYIRFNPEFTDPESGFFYSRGGRSADFHRLQPTNLLAYQPDDVAHVGWFYIPAETKTGTWIAPYYNQNIETKIISYTVPIFINNVFVGVVGMDIDFKMIQDIVASTSVYETGFAFLTDSDAYITHHRELEPGTNLVEYNGGEFHGMAEMLRNGETNDDLIRYSYRGEKRAAAFRSLSNGMRFVLAAPVREIDAEANELIFQILFAVGCIVLVAAIFTVVYTRRLVKPLLELTQAAKKIADGDLSVTITHQSRDEVGALADSFRQTVEHLHKYIAYINELAYRDPLTGVKNKTAYLEITVRMDELTRLKRPQYAVAVFDINDLKKVNDTRGHDFGDMLIIAASRIICKVFKHSPVYRIGGDEFVALLENTDYDRYAGLLEQLEDEVRDYNAQPSSEIKVSIARGIAVFSEGTDLTFNDVFKRADSAMYRNKADMKAHLHGSAPEQ